MITIYQTTKPRFTDTKKILRDKLAQCQRSGPVDPDLTQTITYPSTAVRWSDSEYTVLAKTLQECN